MSYKTSFSARIFCWINERNICTQKLTSVSPAMVLVRQKFDDGQISGQERSKQMWQSSDLFEHHKLASLRAHWYPVQNEYKCDDNKSNRGGNTKTQVPRVWSKLT